MAGGAAVDGNRPEAAVARHIPEKAGGGIGGAEDDALARMAFHNGAIGDAELVILAGGEALDGLDIDLPDAGHFGELDNPVALQLFGAGLVAHVGDGHGVGEPAAAKAGKERGLADALGPGEDEDVVKLFAGTIDTGHGGNQGLADHGAGVGAILGTEVINQEGIQAGRTVPGRQAFQILPDRVKGTLGSGGEQGGLELLLAVDVVNTVQVRGQGCEVCVGPAALERLPREKGRVADINAAAVLVVADALQAGVVAEDFDKVGEGLADAAVLIQLQGGLPVGVRGRVRLGEVRLGLFFPLSGQQGTDRFILQSKGTHGGIGRKRGGGGVGLCLVVQL